MVRLARTHDPHGSGASTSGSHRPSFPVWTFTLSIPDSAASRKSRLEKGVFTPRDGPRRFQTLAIAARRSEIILSNCVSFFVELLNFAALDADDAHDALFESCKIASQLLDHSP